MHSIVFLHIFSSSLSPRLANFNGERSNVFSDYQVDNDDDDEDTVFDLNESKSLIPSSFSSSSAVNIDNLHDISLEDSSCPVTTDDTLNCVTSSSVNTTEKTSQSTVIDLLAGTNDIQSRKNDYFNRNDSLIMSPVHSVSSSMRSATNTLSSVNPAGAPSTSPHTHQTELQGLSLNPPFDENVIIQVSNYTASPH